ncbi:succinate dehydrogenase assembly factor 2 [SAR86 cluster bacterium]|jgi:succinate dehydrogenase flavin-adding protein (antitoxin of CptAB toxin-antitoxin module)|nr:succinate dehydrogenase assembly factor 2 [SAR86 cluster bacterium]
MDKELLIKKLHFKSRRGFKETSDIIKNFLKNIYDMDLNALNELEKLLNLDEQEIYDLLILDKERFREEFSNLKNFS